MAKDTVVVGCKLPNGLEIEVGGVSVTLRGANSSEIIGGHGLTEVSKDFWDAWIDQHRDFAPVKAELIFAQENEARAKSEAKEKKETKSGFEGINPEKPGDGVEKASDKNE